MTAEWEDRRYFADEDDNREFQVTVQRLSHGNPGAILVLGMIAGRSQGIYDLIMARYKIIELRGWVGPELWGVWKDQCGQDADKLIAAIMA